MSYSPHRRRLPRILLRVVDSRHPETVRTGYRKLPRLRSTVRSSSNYRIAMILARLFRVFHSPAKAFRLYCSENPWALEARIYDV